MGTRKTTPVQTPPVDDDRILTTKQLLERIPLDYSTIWRMSKQGRFPRPLQLTRSRIGWRLSAVLAWLAERETDPIESRQYFGTDKKSA